MSKIWEAAPESAEWIVLSRKGVWLYVDRKPSRQEAASVVAAVAPGCAPPTYGVPAGEHYQRPRKYVGKPSWADAPSWARWLWQQPRGQWVWSSQRPQSRPYDNGWEVKKGKAVNARRGAPNKHFRNTLERHPCFDQLERLRRERDQSRVALAVRESDDSGWVEADRALGVCHDLRAENSRLVSELRRAHEIIGQLVAGQSREAE